MNAASLLVLDAVSSAFRAAPRFWKANFCGVRVPGLPPVAGGAADPSLVLSWFYDRYDGTCRSAIRSAWTMRGQTHVVLSWPDSRAVGQSPAQFGATCQELIGAGFFPCVFLCSKDFDPHNDVPGILANIAPVLPFILKRVPLVCIGWELGIDGWLSATDIQDLTDALAPQFTAYGCRVYVHFQSGYSHFAQHGGYFADYWNLNVGKLTGVLRQRILSQTMNEYRNDSGGIVDVLVRFAGNFGVVPDSGFGHPFDDVELEITAQLQFYNVCTEADGNDWGQWAIETPAQTGPAGSVSVMGSGNGS